MRRNKRGFTLVELMIVVAILGILASIAVPLYRGYIKTARKSEAKANLEAIRLLEEQYFADEGEYEFEYHVSPAVYEDNIMFMIAPNGIAGMGTEVVVAALDVSDCQARCSSAPAQ